MKKTKNVLLFFKSLFKLVCCLEQNQLQKVLQGFSCFIG
jgi:hypothetical protein